MTFNHGVEGSSPSALTNIINDLAMEIGLLAQAGFFMCTRSAHYANDARWGIDLDRIDAGLFHMGFAALAIFAMLLAVAALYRRRRQRG